MAKIEISIAINLVNGAIQIPLKGRSGVSKDFICIPVENLSIDKKGKAWLNFVGYDDTKFEGQTHSIKEKLSKAQWEALPQDANGRRQAPYVGSVKRADNAAAQAAPAQAQAQPQSYSTCADDGDLPF